MFRFSISFVLFSFVFFQSVFAGFYEGVNLYEQQKYREAYQELYPLKGGNIYAHPYILDLYKNHAGAIDGRSMPLSSDDLIYLTETSSLPAKGNLAASKIYIKISNKLKAHKGKKKVNTKSDQKELEALRIEKISRAQYLTGKLTFENKIESKDLFLSIKDPLYRKDVTIHNYYFTASSNGDIDAIKAFMYKIELIKNARKKEQFKNDVYGSMNPGVGEKYFNNFSLMNKLICKNDDINSIASVYTLLLRLEKNGKDPSFYLSALLKAASWGSEEAQLKIVNLLFVSSCEDETLNPFKYMKTLEENILQINLTVNTSDHLITLLHFLAYKNHSKMQFYLAMLYDPKNEHCTFRKSELDAANMQNNKYAHTININTNNEKAYFWYDQASNNGFLDAKCLCAIRLYKDLYDETQKPLLNLMKLAEQSEKLVSMCYDVFFNISDHNSIDKEAFKGIILRKCFDIYIRLFSYLNINAQQKLFEIIRKGSEGEIDEVHCNEIMAEAHLKELCNYKKDFHKIIQYYTKIASKSEIAGKNLAYIYMFGDVGFNVTQQSKKTAEKICLDLLERPEFKDDADLMYKLAVLYDELYESVEEGYNPEKALYYLLKAARFGNLDAMTAIGMKYFMSQDNYFDYYKQQINEDEAFNYLKNAHDAGVAQASFIYSMLMMSGYSKTVPKDLKKSHHILNDLSSKDEGEASDNAKLMLGFFEAPEQIDSLNSDSALIVSEQPYEVSKADSEFKETIQSIMTEIEQHPDQSEEISSDSDNEDDSVENPTIIIETPTDLDAYQDIDPAAIHRAHQARKIAISTEDEPEVNNGQIVVQSEKKLKKKKEQKLLDKFKGSYVSKASHAQFMRLMNVLGKEYKTKMTPSKGSNINFEVGDNILKMHKPAHSNVGRIGFGRSKSIKDLLSSIEGDDVK
ncbi:MAG: tetratricopeptide repeat protein [Alphaproteobacteria bacterium]|nr:tetratricopeptide repeat protein [Alphaproteobacteria bacterium]